MKLTEDQLMFQETARKFAEEVVAPRAIEIDETEEFPHDIYQKMAEVGFLGLTLGEEYGGIGVDTVSFSLVVEELSKASAAIGNAMCVAIEQAEFISHFGTQEQKEKYVPGIISGEIIPAFALTENGAGSDSGALKLSAVRDGDEYVLNGTKIFITMGQVCDVAVVFARTADLGTKGVSAFLVDKGTPGFSVGSKEKILGIRGLGTSELVFDEVRVPASAMVGEENKGFKLAMAGLDTGRIAMASMALGIAEAALEAAVDYSKTRVQFNQPICKFQGIQFMLADMATGVQASKLLIHDAAEKKDSGERFSQEASMAKLFTTDTAMKVATDAVQIFGGYGYSMEYPVQKYFREAKLPQIFEGTNQIQRMLIGRNLTR